MTTVITAPDTLPDSGFMIFLAGAIDMGRAAEWQDKIIGMLQHNDDLVLLNPRRENFTPDTLDPQIRWELDALDRSDAIIMWFPKDAAAPISFLETGLYMAAGKLVIGAEAGFYRRRNLELTCEYYGVELHETLGQIAEAAVGRYEANALWHKAT